MSRAGPAVEYDDDGGALRGEKKKAIKIKTRGEANGES